MTTLHFSTQLSPENPCIPTVENHHFHRFPANPGRPSVGFTAALGCCGKSRSWVAAVTQAGTVNLNGSKWKFLG